MRGAVRIVLAALLAVLAWPAPGTRAQSQEFVIIFGTGASQLTPEAEQIVTLIARRAAERPAATLAVAGYGDADAGDDAALADRRAAAVIRALVSAGLAPARIKQVPRAPPAAATGIPVHKVTVSLRP